ncbi:hypothetical protein [Streptococcus marmotae]|uniref:hypothetical protein n=1 Tax=Streptococcus marmotae TaxID=1825069 RepID=UPI000832BB7F|nr:hypothetical protein [Streptococcus marmotae]
MVKKSSFIICAVTIIVTNMLMILFFNNGEEITSNIFLIILTLFLLPPFLRAVDNQMQSLLRLESYAFLFLASLSVMRLINRVTIVPIVVNSIMILLALGIGIMLITASIMRIYKKNRNS